MLASVHQYVVQPVISLASTGVSVSRSIYSWLTTSPSTTYYEPSPYLHQQSVIEDEKTGVRVSVYQVNEEEYDGLKVHRQLFEFALSKFRNRPCFGKRVNFDSPAEWQTYEEVDQRIRAVGSALTKLVASSTAGHTMIGICGLNSPEWVLTQQACGAYSMVSVPLYDTLGEESLKHIVSQTRLATVVCDKAEQAKWFLQLFSDQLVLVIVINHNEEFNHFRESYDCKTKLISFQELIDLGKSNLIPPKMASEDDLCLICYTSGTSGKPKGATFSHAQYVSFIKNVIRPMKIYGLDLSCVRHVSYLPLSHLMEQMVLCAGFLLGSQVGFLTDGHQGLMQDLRYFKPNIFLTVPRVLSRIESAILKSVNNSKIKKYVLNSMVDQKIREQRRGIFKEGGLLDHLIFKKVREEFGGCIKLIITGSAPLSRDTDHLIRAVFCCPVIEGYGSTELGGIISVGLLCDLTGEQAGALVPGARVLLMDVPEMDIIVQRDGVGEVCVSSKTCTGSYYEDEENTRVLFHDNGFLRTGDIGGWTEFGQLKIMDRCKSMFKLCQGEYVAPAKVEKVYSMCPLVAQIYVDGDPMQAFPIAIVVPEMEELRQRCAHLILDQKQVKSGKEAKNPTLADEELCSHPAVRQFVVSELRELGKKEGLKGFEQVKLIHLTSEPFTIENQLLTSTAKISRPSVRRKYSDIIAKLYTENHL